MNSQAADDSAAFLDALRDHKHYDLALEYLDRSASDPLVSAELKDRIPYERAVTLLEQAQGLTSQSARAAAVESAQRDLDDFISSSKSPKLAAEASAKLAAALVSGAVENSAKSRLRSEKERQQALVISRKSIKDAQEYYDKAEQFYEEALKPLQSVQPGSPQADERLNLRFQLAQCRLARVSAKAEQARTHRADSSDFKQLMEEAAREFGELYQKYDTAKSVGVAYYAHLYEGRSYLELGNHRLADGCFEMLLTLPPEEQAFRRLITLACGYLVQSLVEQNKLDEALQQGQQWLDELQRTEQREPQALSLKYQLGEAARLAAAGTEDRGKTRELLSQARDYYTDASRGLGEHQADARLKLLELSGDSPATPSEATTFDEAYQLAATALSSIAALQTAAAQDPKEETQQQLASARGDALAACRQALLLADDDTPIERINNVRYWMSHVYYEQDDYLRCAAVAEFLTTKFPSDPSAEQAARLALVAFDRLYHDAKQQGEDTHFASDQSVQIADFITRRWAGEPLADTAFDVLLATALRDNRMEDAQRVVAAVSPDKRPSLELRLAVAAWEQAAKANSSPSDLSAAQQQLAEAVQANRSAGPVSQYMALATLLLTQAHVNQGDAAAAAALLEDPEVGPLTLVNNQAAAIADNAGYVSETYRTALQTYLTLVPPRTPDAMQMMGKLEEGVADKSTLLRNYIALGVRLQKQIQSLNEAGKTSEAMRVSDAFAEFVGRISESPDGADWTTQQWMAQTFLQLGEGLDDSGDQEAAVRFYEKARDGFQKLLELGERDPSAAPGDTSMLAVRLQLANSLRHLREYEPAMEMFTSLLKEREMMLDVQKSAAYTLQEWGQAEDTSHLTDSIRGTTPKADGKNLVWGWSKLAAIAGRAARTQPKYRDLFFESWLNVATSRYLAGMKDRSARRQKQFDSATKTILLLSRQYPDLGGPQLRSQFDALLKKIQTAEGKDPVGLGESSSETS